MSDYIISLYYREGLFFPSFQLLCCIKTAKEIFRWDFSMEQLPIDSYMLQCKQKDFN